jgi:putative membrane-bound dehydrogenase-like protein
MKTWPLLLLLALPCPALAQVTPEKAAATFQVAEGVEMALWASEPLFVNPTCIDIDHKGRVWVCESVNYRCQLRGRPLRRPEGDRILILEDTRGTGHADKATVFYQAPELLAPLGIAVAKDPAGPGYKVFVCQSPDILVFEDRDGDGKADGPPKKLLTGFQGIDHDHGVHGILIGPDRKLYFSVGDQGVRNLQSSDGKGRKWTSNDTDCRAGTIWRCNLDGTRLELLAHNFRNEYEPCVDSFGTVFVSDNDDDGNEQTRICYVMPGGNYGYHPRGPGQTHWHEEQPGVVPKILRTYFGSPTGMCFYEGTLLPKKYQGQLLHTDAGPRHVRCYHLTPKGAGYDVAREDMVTSSDTWFRPSDVCVAPDGSVFVSDWYDPGVGGHGMGDTARGRIYRLAPKGSKYQVPEVSLETPDGALRALASPNQAVRYMAMIKVRSLISDFPETQEAVKLLQEAAKANKDPILRARVCWQMASEAQDAKDVLSEALSATLVTEAWDFLSRDPDPRFRGLALRILKDSGISEKGFPLTDLLKHPFFAREAASVCREALLAIKGADPAKARPLILQLCKQYDGQDRFYLEALGIAVGHHDKARRDVILADFDKEFPEWNEKVADLVWELRPPSMMPKLEKILADDKLPAKQRARVIDILAASNDLAAGQSLLKAVSANQAGEVRERIAANLQLFLPGKWSGLRDSQELGQAVTALLERPDTVLTALTLIEAAGRPDALPRVTELAQDAKQSETIRKGAIKTLGTLRSPEAVAALEQILQQAPTSLRVEACKALAGQLQPRRRDATEARTALKLLQDAVTATGQDLAVRRAAVAALATSPNGSQWLLDLHAHKELPDALKADTGRLLRNSPFEGLRSRALAAFPTPAKIDRNKLPAIEALAVRRGDAERGKQFLATTVQNDLQCLKCHTIHGTGGKIGPDLSAIGTKASRENLFESILYPSKAIADQFLSWNVVTKKGTSLTGLIVEETPARIVLRDANGTDHPIAKEDMEERTKSPTSLMPDNLLAYMTEEDLLDIVEYLYSLKTEPRP